MVVVYKWGGIVFDDKSLIKTLILPSEATDATPITFHDNGTNYQVPVGKVFIVGRGMWAIGTTIIIYGRVGESASADGALTKEVINLNPNPISAAWSYEDVIGVYTAEKYVTGETSTTAAGDELQVGTTLYGVEIDA